MFDLLATEFKVQSRHWVWRTALFMSFLFGIFLVNRQTPDTDIQVGGVYFLIKTFSLQLLFLPVLLALFSAQASVRDFESKLFHLTYTSGIRMKQALTMRFVTLLALCWILYLLFALGLVTGLVINGEFNASSSLTAMSWCLFVLLLPSLLFFGAICFAVGLSTKQSLPLYIMATLIFFFYQFFLTISGSPLMASPVAPSAEVVIWYTALDVHGLTGFFEQAKGWTATMKNHVMPNLPVEQLLNRLGVAILGILIISFAISRHIKTFSIEHIDRANSAKYFSFNHLFSLPRLTISWPSLLPNSKWLVIARLEWALTVKTKVFAAMCVALVIITGSEIYFGYLHLENMGTSAIASTLITLNRYSADALPLFISLFILVLSAEVCWRDKELSFDPLLTTTKANINNFIFGRMAALVGVAVTLLLVVLLLSVVMQTSYAGEIQLIQYLIYSTFILTSLFWLIAMTVACHWVAPNKYLGLLFSFIIFVLTDSNLLFSAGLEHPLWSLGKLPSLSYSEITGFGDQTDTYFDYVLFRLSLLFPIYLLIFSARDAGKNNANFKLVAMGSTLSLALAANIIFQTWYEGNYQSSSSRHEWKAAYERKYGFLLDKPSLKPDSITSEIQLYPERRQLHISAEYQLKNRTDEKINTLVFSAPKPFFYSNVTVEGAELVELDSEFQVYTFRFDPAISPNETVLFNFDASYQQNEYAQTVFDNFYHESYSYVRFLRYLPWFGFAPHYQLKHKGLRQQYGLAPLITNTLEQDLEKYHGDMSGFYDWARYTTRVVTSEGHDVVAPGKLVRQWREGERIGFEYQTTEPIRNLGHLVSLQLPHIAETKNGIETKVYYPNGKRNYAELHQSAMQDAIAYGLANFGKLNTTNIRLVPAPNFFPSTGYALPQTIFIGEGVGFHVDLANGRGFDHLYRRTVHEVAHQWWGHGLNGAPTEGEAVLVETLAKYTEMILLEKKYGVEYVKRLINYEQQRYFSGRGRSEIKELPLYRGDENHLVYSKGSAAMYALRHELGEQVINQALAKLIENHSYPDKPATTLDLINYLKLGQSQTKQRLIDTWLMEVDSADLRFTSVDIDVDGKNYSVTACVENSYQKDVVTDLSVQSLEGKAIANTQIKAGTCISLSLDEMPSSLTLDPELMLLDSDRYNNRYLFEN